MGRLTLQTLINTYPDSEYLAKGKLAIADSFFSGREPALVNGVLDTISRKAAAGGTQTAPP